MKNILVVSGHTDLKKSVANKMILEEFYKKLCNAEYVILDELYPDFKIDIEKEQEKLMKADVIILQFPVFWYSMPSLMKKWIEDAFAHGFSHGTEGDKLKGKKLIASFTTGAPEYMYSYDGVQKYPIKDFLPHIKAMCSLCGMEFAGFIYTGGVSYQSRNDDEKLKEIKEKSIAHADKVVEMIEKL